MRCSRATYLWALTWGLLFAQAASASTIVQSFPELTGSLEQFGSKNLSVDLGQTFAAIEWISMTATASGELGLFEICQVADPESCTAQEHPFLLVVAVRPESGILFPLSMTVSPGPTLTSFETATAQVDFALDGQFEMFLEAVSPRFPDTVVATQLNAPIFLEVVNVSLAIEAPELPPIGHFLVIVFAFSTRALDRRRRGDA